MLGGFDPRSEDLFLRRRRWRALVIALLLSGGATGLSWLLAPPPHEDNVVVELQPEISDFDVEEQAEPEPEPEPPPPPNTKVKVVQQPKPAAKPKPPKKKVEGEVEESSKDKVVEVGAGGSAGGTGNGPPPTDAKPKPAPKPEPKPEPKPKPKPKAAPKIDPTQPIDRPENATVPKPLASNQVPAYPKELRDKGVTGSVLIKLHIHRDGSVRGAKVLRKKNNATTEEDAKRADALFLKAVISAVKTWAYTPAKLNGEPITVWHKVNIPFSLTSAD